MTVSMRNHAPEAIAATAVATTALAGSLAVDTSSTWYGSLDLPRWQPPPAAFGPVWTALYASMAGAGARAWRRTAGLPRQRSRVTVLSAANLALNAGWNAVFFRAHRPGAALAVITALQATTLALIAELRRTSPRAATALVPYALWTAFATVLNAEIVRRNGH